MKHINLPEDLFNPARMPARCKDGFVSHPDCDLIYHGLGNDDEGETTNQFIKDLGYEFCNLFLDDDAEPEIADRYFEAGEADCSYWTPNRPQGDGWLLLWITDSDDGPVACYARKASHD